MCGGEIVSREDEILELKQKLAESMLCAGSVEHRSESGSDSDPLDVSPPRGSLPPAKHGVRHLL